MSREEIFQKFTDIFRDIFADESIVLSDSTSAKDIEGWDSFQQINLIVAIEDVFGLEVPLKRVEKLNNVGEMVTLIQEELE